MTAGPTRQQSRLLPYLLAILVVLLGYVVYTRVLSPGRPAPVVVATPPPVAATPAPAPSPEPTPAGAASPAPAASPGPGVAVVPALPSGRPNPFAALVTEQAARPAPPPPPPVPPPFFPGQRVPPLPGEAPQQGRPQEVAVPFRPTGTVVLGGTQVAVLRGRDRMYFAGTGEVVEGFRIRKVEQNFVKIGRGSFELTFELKEVEAP